MNCREFQELISAAVDLQLPEGELAAFKDHSGKCPPCRFEYEAEAATKLLICSRAKRVHTPASVALRISEHIAREESGGRRSRFAEFFSMPLVKPAIGFALAFAVVLLLLRDSGNVGSPVPDDVILQSLLNHRAVLEGAIRPQFASNEPTQMASFFSGIADYSVFLPVMKDCRLIGGVKNDFAGTKIAHIMYQHDHEMVYIYQTCWATVRKGEKLHLPSDIRDELVRTGWFSATQPDGRSIVLWTKGRTLCAAVAKMSKEDLLACVTSGERSW